MTGATKKGPRKGATKKGPRKLLTRCDSGAVLKTAALLPHSAKLVVKQLGFGHMLGNLPHRLKSRALPGLLVKTAQVEDKIIKWTIGNKTIRLTASGVWYILCVGKTNGTSLELAQAQGWHQVHAWRAWRQAHAWRAWQQAHAWRGWQQAHTYQTRRWRIYGNV